MNSFHPSRREFLQTAGCGLGALATSSILSNSANGSIRQPHFPGRAKSVIWLFMNGGPSGIDIFDEKPTLKKWDGKKFPGSIETLFPHPGPIMKSPFAFRRYGECGQEVSEVYPHIAKHVDDITFLKACSGTGQNHTPACYAFNSGVTRVGSPSIGSWVTYGLGCETQDLPAYVVMYDHRAAPEGGANLWDAAYLPGETQAVTFNPGDQPIMYLAPPEGTTRSDQRRQLKLLRRLNRMHQASRPDDLALDAGIKSFETAFRMQIAAPEIVDISSETESTQRLYGLDVEETQHFGMQLLMARKMVEQGVRFVQIYHGGFDNNWDHHGELEVGHRARCYESDRPIAGLLTDLKQRGLLDDTLVVWGGEFGRTPTSQDRFGRDHNPFGFCTWLAGGGVKGGMSYGETDEFGYRAVNEEVTIHDLHATILHLLGLDHERLTFRHNGRDQSLVNGLGHVVENIMA